METNNIIKVVLVEPAGTLNVGSIARLCENFGVDELRLTSPKCNHLDKDAKRMAVKGIKFLEEAKVYDHLSDALSDCSRIIATCGRKEHGDIPLFSNKKALEWATGSTKGETIALVFGREDRGLSNEELLKAHKIISLDANQKYPSLNLSHAVAIILHQLNELKNFNSFEKYKSQNNPANITQLEDCLNDAGHFLLDIGFLMSHTSKARMSKIKKLLQRAEIRDEEVALIRGIIQQSKWAIKNKGAQSN